MAAHCPHCRSTLEETAVGCNHCSADFTEAGGWKPVSQSEPEVKRGAYATSKTLTKLGIAAVGAPLIAFLVGLLLAALIPGCQCDASAGCVGCTANALLAGLIFGGFSVSLGALFTALPACLVLAAVFRRQRD